MVDVGTRYTFGKKTKAVIPKQRLVEVGTRFFFDLAETGDYIARRLIPVRYIGV